jgi:hypothetical protein
MPRVKKEKKKSKYQVGNEHQEEYHAMMESDGYICHTTPQAKRWESNKDMYNLFDTIGLRYDGIKLVQTKTRDDGGSIKDIQEWIRQNHSNIPPHTEFEVAVKKYACKTKPARWVIHKIPLNPDLPVTKKEVIAKCQA